MSPRRRTEQLVVQEVGDELVIYDQRSHRAHRLNRVAAAVWKQCDGKTDAEAMAAIISQNIEEHSAETVAAVFEQLDESGLLEAPLPNESRGLSRRAFARIASVAVPFVLTIVVPTAAHAAASTHQNG